MKRSKFSLSHYKMLPMNHGPLVPCGLVEVLPGDSIQHATSLLIRTQPLVTPVMHPDHVRIFHFFVPFRIIWEDWEDFITGGDDPDVEPTFPTVTINNAALNSLADYLGIPTGVAQNKSVSALPFRAYALIFNEWMRDQDLVAKVGFSKASGVDATTNTSLLYSAWEKDYFTTARPWAQKGDAVTLPLGTEADVITNGQTPQFRGTTEGVDRNAQVKTSTGYLNMPGFAGADQPIIFGTETGLKTDLQTATAATVNDIRLAMALQRYQEARARYGSRYTEYLRYLGIRSSDARLQRPELLGSSKQTITFSEVIQTGVTTSGNTAGVGNLRGHGIGTMRSNRYRRFFEEHGYIVSLLNVIPRTVYFEGLERHWTYNSRNDFFQKELQHIGQQEVRKDEIYMQGISADAETWGYQDRYDHLRRMESRVHGDFKTTLNSWHMARDFAGLPTLNSSFVTADPTNRIFADTAASQLYVMAYHSIQARRILSQVGTSNIF